MKKLIIILLVLSAGITFAHTKHNYKRGVSFEVFYNSLSPHGEWLSIDAGIYAWRPFHANAHWKPYSNGRWHWTEHGWYWDSYEPYGWATYHYGRWFYDDFNGWLWVPDYEWAPAWVEWRYNDNYIGWAPLPPYASLRVNIGIHFSVGWRSHYVHWNFVKYRHFCNNNINGYYVSDYNRRHIFKRTKYRTNYYYDGQRIINRGISRRFVEKRVGYKIHRRNIVYTNDRTYFKNRNYSEKKRTLRAYKPEFNEGNRRSYNDYDRKIRKTNKTSLNVRSIKKRNGFVEKKRLNKKTVRNRKNTIELRKDKNVDRNKSTRIKKKSTSRRYYPEIRKDSKKSVARKDILKKKTSISKNVKKKRKDIRDSEKRSVSRRRR